MGEITPLLALELTELTLREASIRDNRDGVVDEHPAGSEGKLPGKQDRVSSSLPQTLELRVHWSLGGEVCENCETPLRDRVECSEEGDSESPGLAGDAHWSMEEIKALQTWRLLNDQSVCSMGRLWCGSPLCCRPLMAAKVERALAPLGLSDKDLDSPDESSVVRPNLSQRPGYSRFYSRS